METHGGTSINIDSDQLDVKLGPAGDGWLVPIRRLPDRRRHQHQRHRGVVRRSAAGVVAHAWQQPPGGLTWSALHSVGESPAGMVSNPAVAQADGRLTLFARNAAGRIEHGWQQAGFPNDWEWAKPLDQARR